MTRLLEHAFDEASRLDESKQDAFARWLLVELSSERRWDESLARSPDTLRRLASEALAEHRAGRTQPLDPDTL